MKKLLYLLVSTCIMGAAFADYDFSQAAKNTPMPTDAEIRATISKFNFDDNQKEIIFRETKMRLQELYAKDAKGFNDELNQNYKLLDSASGEYLDEKLIKETKKKVNKLPETKQSSESYENYDNY